jgi:hypothetical protein
MDVMIPVVYSYDAIEVYIVPDRDAQALLACYCCIRRDRACIHLFAYLTWNQKLIRHVVSPNSSPHEVSIRAITTTTSRPGISDSQKTPTTIFLPSLLKMPEIVM